MCRLPAGATQRRRIGAGEDAARVRAWAQAALLRGLCPTMDAVLDSPAARSSNGGGGGGAQAGSLCGAGGGNATGSGEAQADVAAAEKEGDTGPAAETAADVPAAAAAGQRY